MEKPTVYVETSVVSYLTARPSRDVVVAERQRMTQEWWDRRGEFRLVTSPIVLAEAGRGDKDWAERRLRVIGGFRAVEYEIDQAEALADHLIRGGSLPAVARGDALHVAIATLSRANYLATWNLKHLANRTIRKKIEKLTGAAGWEPVTIVTPEELLEAMP